MKFKTLNLFPILYRSFLFDLCLQFLDVDETMVHPKTLHFSPMLDLDSNNLLDINEFKSWYSPRIDLKVNEDLKAFNLSSDSILNRSTILSYCELLLQSQITDYGMIFFKDALLAKDEL